MDELQRRKRLLDDSLTELKRKKKQAKTVVAAAEKVWRLTEPMLRVTHQPFTLSQVMIRSLLCDTYTHGVVNTSGMRRTTLLFQ